MTQLIKQKITEILEEKAGKSNIPVDDLINFNEESIQEVLDMLHESVRRQLETIDVLDQILKILKAERRIREHR